jgi:hypothetical protein
MRKNIKSFVCVEVRILLEKFNVYEGHIFPRPLLETCRLETTSLCLNTRLLVKKNFQILIIFIEISVNVCLLFEHQLMKRIILHSRRPNSKEKVLRTWFLCFSLFSFTHFEELKSTFFTSFHFAPRGMY